MSGRRFDTLIDLAPEMTRKDPHQIAMNVLTTDTLNEQTVLVDDGCHVLKTIWNTKIVTNVFGINLTVLKSVYS